MTWLTITRLLDPSMILPAGGLPLVQYDARTRRLVDVANGRPRTIWDGKSMVNGLAEEDVT